MFKRFGSTISKRVTGATGVQQVQLLQKIQDILEYNWDTCVTEEKHMLQDIRDRRETCVTSGDTGDSRVTGDTCVTGDTGDTCVTGDTGEFIVTGKW